MVIRRLSNGHYALFSLHTGKKLGEFKSLEAAKVREQQISYFKRRELKKRR